MNHRTTISGDSFIRPSLEFLVEFGNILPVQKLTAIAGLPPKPSDARYLSLDACRGAACLLLVMFHATLVADASFKMDQRDTWTFASVVMRLVRLAWAGVPIFFVISGYCIAASVDSMRRKPFTLWSYFSRRIRRIYPPLWIMLTLGIAFVLVLGAFHLIDPTNVHLPHLEDFTLSNWIGNFSASEWWLHRVIGGDRHMLMINTWTLCFEEQFYLVMGLVLLVAVRRMFLASVLISLATLAARHVCRAQGWNAQGFFYEGHWLLFAAGILVYQRLNYLKGSQAMLASCALALGIVYGAIEYKIGKSIGAVDKERGFFVQHFGEYLMVAHAFALALIACRPWDRAIVRSAAVRPLLFCGRISYSIYLTHYLPIITVAALLSEKYGIHDDGRVVLFTLPICLLLMLPIAWTFHVLVERRFLNAPQDDADARKSSGAKPDAITVRPQSPS